MIDIVRERMEPGRDDDGRRQRVADRLAEIAAGGAAAAEGGGWALTTGWWAAIYGFRPDRQSASQEGSA